MLNEVRVWHIASVICFLLTDKFINIMEVNIENAIRCALDEAERKNDMGLLIPCNHPKQEEIFEEGVEGVEGDPETVYSIASLYADEESSDETWLRRIEGALEEVYPTYF